jgi:outer membrane lipoprotein-sorting protein
VSELDADAVTPKNMFTIYESDFKSKVKEKKGKVTVIDLFPMNPKEKDYSIVRIDVDTEKLQVNRAMVLAKNGTHYTYRIDKLTPDKTFDDSIFKFDKSKYPGVKIIE